MTEEDFSKLSLIDKWVHLKKTMDYIVQMDNVYSLRRRLNPHHAEDQKKEETRNLRVDQYQRWSHVKNLYAEHRDEMANALDSQDFEKCKAILERIFTMEVDDALRDILEE